jgi:AcrR family transcriptional regulator/DNA-binding MarR family transcriptional regulator
LGVTLAYADADARAQGSRALAVSGADGVAVAGADGLARKGHTAPEVPGRERVAELQRARIIVAMGELVRERGIGAVTVAHIVARSGVSRRTYYEVFADRDDCLLATFDHAVERAAAATLPAYRAAAASLPAHRAAAPETGGSWERQIRAGLEALLRFLDDEPALAGLLVVDALAAERPVLERRAQVLRTLVDVVHQGGRPRERPARRGESGRRPARITAEGVVGAVLAVVHARLLARDSRALRGLLNELMAMIVLPYLGPASAELERRRPLPRARRRAASLADPLRELDMRLTYRTVRVLLAIAELGLRGSNPSGRQVADAAGVADQGQMSKLLARLRQLGLIENSAGWRGRGEPNAWVLTAKGKDVERAIRAQTES